jgi:hypothetical protein
MSDARTIWKQRLASWRASGESAEKFSAGRGYAASTLKWWASKLRSEAAVTPVVRVAQLVRSPAERVGRQGSIIVEGLDRRVRITIEPGADRDALAVVLDMLGSRADR